MRSKVVRMSLRFVLPLAQPRGPVEAEQSCVGELERLGHVGAVVRPARACSPRC